MTKLVCTVRFVEGYRYLDRAGEAMIKFKRTLDNDWLTKDVAPSGGQLRNFKLGMTLLFDSESMTTQQEEYISSEHFQEQTCKAYEVLWSVFEVDRILAPGMRVVFQKGFRTPEESEEFLGNLDLFSPSRRVMGFLEGDLVARRVVMITEQDTVWQGASVTRRRRLECGCIQQQKSPDIDARLLRRLALIPKNERDAVRAVMELRREHRTLAPAAAQFDVETSCEDEFSSKTFDLPGFIQEAVAWSEHIQELVGDR
jgi:hypothetical protein